MRKGVKIFFIILGIIVVMELIFISVDYNRLKNNKKPMFCIYELTACDYAPSGTLYDVATEYFGLGYKIIDFYTLEGFDDIKIGTWFMKFNDFEEEMKLFEKNYNNILKIY